MPAHAGEDPIEEDDDEAALGSYPPALADLIAPEGDEPTGDATIGVDDLPPSSSANSSDSTSAGSNANSLAGSSNNSSPITTPKEKRRDEEKDERFAVKRMKSTIFD